MKYDFIEIGTSHFDTILQNSNDTTIGLSIEPLKFYLDQLPNKLNIQKVNYAISDKNYTSKVYYIDPQDIIKYMLDDFLFGCNSLDSPHPTASYVLKQRKLEHLMREQTCECITWNLLCSKYSVDFVELLKIDAEGHDHIIIKNILTTSTILPNTIHYESNELTSAIDKRLLLDLLRTRGYGLISDDFNNIAVSRISTNIKE